MATYQVRDMRDGTWGVATVIDGCDVRVRSIGTEAEARREARKSNDEEMGLTRAAYKRADYDV